MTSSCNWRNKHQVPTAIVFFKIILGKTLEDGKLKLPNSFTRKYGGGLSNPMFLKPPDGTEWKVEWAKHDGGILFEKGWKEFATYYSLDHGHLMLFEYKETCHFEVHVFGMSGLEIDYPFHDQIGDDSVEILNELPPRRPGLPKKRLKSPMSSPPTSKKLKSATRTRDVKTSLNPQGSQSEETHLEMPIFASANQVLDGKKLFPTTSKALKEAMKFKSENPSFIVKIRQGNLKGTAPNFSIFFFRKYFNNMKQIVKIRFGTKVWPAKLIYYPIKSSWRLFAQASKLQAGDVCIFELVNRKDPVLDVHVYRGHG